MPISLETLEQIFCLLTLIQSKLRNPRGKRFAIFVDAKMAFDSCKHDKMWKVLEKRGISSKFLQILISLYNQAKGQILTPNGLTESFYFQRGVFQGEPNSSLLFNYFIDGLARRLKMSGIMPVKVGKADFHLLLFPDDLVIVANSDHDLQRKIHVAAKFFEDRGLQVNIAKTKVVIFAKRKETRQLSFKWDQNNVEIVDNYTYLGVVMHRNGTFNHNHKTSKEKGMAAVGKVLEILRKSGVPPLTTQFQLFKSIARASLLYGAPIWAMKRYQDMDRLQNHFLRRILRLPPTTPDYFIRLETGCQDTRVQFLIGFWERMCAKSEESPAKQCMLTQIKWSQTNITDMQRKYCWAEDFLSFLKKS